MSTLLNIYKASHPVEGVYVGISVMSVHRRRQLHLSAAIVSGRYPHSLFYAALRKTEGEGWTWELLRQVTATRDQAGKLEAQAIFEHQANLNIRQGGSGGGVFATRLSRVSRKIDSEVVHRLRVDGATQKEVAQRVGCSRSYVSQLLGQRPTH